MGVFTPRALCLLLATATATAASPSGTLGSSVSPCGKDYFDFEQFQLQPSDLQHLDASDATLFDFDSLHGHNANTPRSQASCKVYPGDEAWPEDAKWASLNKTTGGALVRGVPRASTCYSGPGYDAADCQYLTSQWTNSYFQYVTCIICIPAVLLC